VSFFFIELVCARVKPVAERLGQRALDPVVPDDPADRGQHVAALTPERPVFGQVVELDHSVLVGPLRLLGGAEHVRARITGRP